MDGPVESTASGTSSAWTSRSAEARTPSMQQSIAGQVADWASGDLVPIRATKLAVHLRINAGPSGQGAASSGSAFRPARPVPGFSTATVCGWPDSS